MTDQIEDLLKEMNFEAKKALLVNEPTRPTIFGQKPNSPDFDIRFQDKSGRKHKLDDLPELARTMIRSQWPWEVCKGAFPHDVVAATRLYFLIHGDDPPYLKG